MRATYRLRQLNRTLQPSKLPQPNSSLIPTSRSTSTSTSAMSPSEPPTTSANDSINEHDKNDIPISIPPDLSFSQLQFFPAYKTWRSALSRSLANQSTPSHPFNSDPYTLKSITVQSCDFFGGDRLGFLKLKAQVTNNSGEHVPASVFMRGGSVAMMIVLTTTTTTTTTTDENDKEGEEEEYVLLTSQPRIPIGSLNFTELPAGMLDDSGTFTGAAAKEIREETGLDIREDELVDMTKLAIESRPSKQTGAKKEAEVEEEEEEQHLQKAMYPSPGGSDEFVPIFLVRKQMAREEMEKLKGKLTGLRGEGEKITLRLCPLRELWRVGARDGKTLAAWALYMGLKGEGRV